jgi:hypothetical protein
MNKVKIYIFSALSVVLLTACQNPYRNAMERTLPVLGRYESVLNNKTLTEEEAELYLNECKATENVIKEALNNNK